MLSFSRYPAVAFLSAVISLSGLSCIDTKVYQCNEVISIANNTVTEAGTLTESGKTTDPQAMLQAADAIEASATQMQAIEIDDEQLKAYQAQFIDMYQNMAQSTRNFVDAYENSDREAAEAALNKLEAVTSAEQGLVEGINGYCWQG